MRRILWTVFAVSLVLTIPFIAKRMANESMNRAVVIAWDYSAFSLSYGSSGIPDKSAYKSFAESGMNSVILDAGPAAVGMRQGLFDRVLVKSLQSAGFAIIPRLGGVSASGGGPGSDAYLSGLESAMQNAGARYILFSGAAGLEDLEQNELSRIISRNSIIMFITENPEQTGYAGQPRLDGLIEATGRRINRAFAIPAGSRNSLGSGDAAMMWYRSVLDRNVRLICVTPSAESTFKASEQLVSLLGSKGFNVNGQITPLNEESPKWFYGLPPVLCLVSAAGLCLHKYMRDKTKFLKLLSCLSAAAIAILVFWNHGGSLFAAFTSACIFPSWFALYLANSCPPAGSRASLPPALTLCLAALAAAVIPGALVITSSMYDIRYMMHLINYNLAIPSYIVPLAVFTYAFARRNGVPASLKKDGSFRITAGNIILLLLLAAASLYSLARSGSFHLVPVLPLELKIRTLLEQATSARPRFKEFLAGYPGLFLFIYFRNKQSDKMYLMVTGFLGTITAISVLNSFCHGFTPVSVSVCRTVNGLAAGIPAGLLAVGTAALMYKRG